MRYPIYRPRRIREQAPLRRMVRETQLSVDHFIYPLFVVPGDGVRHEIQSMPGNFHLSIDRLLGEVKEARISVFQRSFCLAYRSAKMQWVHRVMPMTVSSPGRSTP